MFRTLATVVASNDNDRFSCLFYKSALSRIFKFPCSIFFIVSFLQIIPHSLWLRQARLRSFLFFGQRCLRVLYRHSRSSLRFCKKSPHLRVVFFVKTLTALNPTPLLPLKQKTTDATMTHE